MAMLALPEAECREIFDYFNSNLPGVPASSNTLANTLESGLAQTHSAVLSPHMAKPLRIGSEKEGIVDATIPSKRMG
jgi:hypothetical protein